MPVAGRACKAFCDRPAFAVIKAAAHIGLKGLLGIQVTIAQLTNPRSAHNVVKPRGGENCERCRGESLIPQIGDS